MLSLLLEVYGPASSYDEVYGSRCIRTVADPQTPADAPLQLTPKEEMETTLIRSLIASYFGITRQTIQDLVPKAIMHLLVCPMPSADVPGAYHGEIPAVPSGRS